MSSEQISGQMIGITMLARIVGKSEDTIRYLERRGIICAVRDSANRRHFDVDQVQRLRDYYAKRTAA